MIFYITSTSKLKPNFVDENNNVVDGNAQEDFFYDIINENNRSRNGRINTC